MAWLVDRTKPSVVDFSPEEGKSRCIINDDGTREVVPYDDSRHVLSRDRQVGLLSTRNGRAMLEIKPLTIKDVCIRATAMSHAIILNPHVREAFGGDGNVVLEVRLTLRWKEDPLQRKIEDKPPEMDPSDYFMAPPRKFSGTLYGRSLDGNTFDLMLASDWDKYKKSTVPSMPKTIQVNDMGRLISWTLLLELQSFGWRTKFSAKDLEELYPANEMGDELERVLLQLFDVGSDIKEARSLTVDETNLYFEDRHVPYVSCNTWPYNYDTTAEAPLAYVEVDEKMGEDFGARRLLFEKTELLVVKEPDEVPPAMPGGPNRDWAMILSAGATSRLHNFFYSRENPSEIVLERYRGPREWVAAAQVPRLRCMQRFRFVKVVDHWIVNEWLFNMTPEQREGYKRLGTDGLPESFWRARYVAAHGYVGNELLDGFGGEWYFEWQKAQLAHLFVNVPLEDMFVLYDLSGGRSNLNMQLALAAEYEETAPLHDYAPALWVRNMNNKLTNSVINALLKYCLVEAEGGRNRTRDEATDLFKQLYTEQTADPNAGSRKLKLVDDWAAKKIAPDTVEAGVYRDVAAMARRTFAPGLAEGAPVGLRELARHSYTLVARILDDVIRGLPPAPRAFRTFRGISPEMIDKTYMGHEKPIPNVAFVSQASGLPHDQYAQGECCVVVVEIPAGTPMASTTSLLPNHALEMVLPAGTVFSFALAEDNPRELWTARLSNEVYGSTDPFSPPVMKVSHKTYMYAEALVPGAGELADPRPFFKGGPRYRKLPPVEEGGRPAPWTVATQARERRALVSPRLTPRSEVLQRIHGRSRVVPPQQ